MGGFLLRNSLSRGGFPTVNVCVALAWLLELDGCAVAGAPGLNVSLSIEEMILFFF